MSDSTSSYFKSVPEELPVRRAKTAVVTGASSGIGLELAKKLSLNGYRVVANSRRITSARTLAETEHIKLVDGDISLPETAERVVATAIRHFGTIDLLVNNAGVFLPKPFTEYTTQDLRVAFATNLFGFLFVSQLAVGRMRLQKSGHVVNLTTSIVSQPTKEGKNQSIMNKLLLTIVSTSQMIVRCERRNARIISFVISALACVLPALALAQQPATMSANAVAKLPFSPGLQLGDTLYVSGHLGVDPAVGKAPSDPEVEARQVLQSVDQTLKEAGLTMDDLVYVEIYCTDLNLYSTFNKEYRTVFKGPFPARDFIGVKDLLFGAHFEIMGIAVRNASLNKGQPPTAE